MTEVLDTPRACSSGQFDYSVVLLGFVLAAVQLLDGFLTAVGVYHFGSHAEGNIIVKSLIDTLGIVEALLLVKAVSISGVMFLCHVGRQIAWLSEALLGLIAIYLYCAILPWTIFISFKLAPAAI